MDIRETPKVGVLLWRGITRACAVCGSRGIARNWLVLYEQCPNCEFRFERSPGHFVGAVGMNTIFTFGLMLVTLLASLGIMWPSVAFVPLLIPPLGVALVVPIAFRTTAQTLWVAIDLAMRPLEHGEAVGGAGEPPS